MDDTRRRLVKGQMSFQATHNSWQWIQPEKILNWEPDDEAELDREADMIDNGETDVVPCPACGWMIYEDAEQCPSCGQYVIQPSRKPTLLATVVIVTLILALLVMTLAI